MRFARGFLRFWYDFLVGDDWKIAAAVGVVLAVGAGIVLSGSYDDHVLTALLALGIAAAFTTALLIDVRRSGR
jgi:multisubunit Na+/H+ antiporter MnhB subunit